MTQMMKKLSETLIQTAHRQDNQENNQNRSMTLDQSQNHQVDQTKVFTWKTLKF